MATTDIEKLVVQLSADVRGYQKSLDRARAATNKTARDIETRFNRVNKSLGTLGTGLKSAFAGFGAGLASSLTVAAIGDMIKQVAALNDEAKKVGVSAEALQAIGFAARQNGADLEDVIGALGVLNRKVAEARSKGKGPLFDLFAANQKTLSDDVLENFRTIADLVKNSRNEIDKSAVASAGLGKAFQKLLPLLNEGAEGIRKLEREARESGAVIDERLVKKADEFDDAWTKAFDVFSTTGKALVLTVAEEIQKLIEQSKEFADFFLKLLPLIDIQGNIAQGRSNIFQLKFLDKFIVGGGPLDIAKQRVEALQAQLDNLIARPDAPQASIELLKKQLQEAKQLAAQLQLQMDRLNKSNRPQFGAPTTGPASSTFTGAPTVVPSSLDTEAADDFAKAVDRFVKIVIDFESKGNITAKNPLSSATGLGQFIESTWLDMFKRHFPDRAKNLSDATILALRNDAETSIALIKAYATENGKILQNAGVAVTEANLQLAHFLGPGGALKVLQAAPGTPVESVLGKDVIAANRGVLAGKTTDQIIAEANARAGLSGAIREQNSALTQLLENNRAEIDELAVKQAELGATTEAQKAYARELELTNQLKQQGVDVTDPAVIALIKEEAARYGEAAQQLQVYKDGLEAAEQAAKDLKEAQEQAAQTAQAVADAFGSAFQGFISDLAHGKKLTDALRDSLLQLGESLLNIALQNLTAGLGSGTGLLGGLFGGGAAGGLFHGGGVVGGGGHSRNVSPFAFAGAQRYHNGGIAGLQQGEVPAILKRGEIIMPNMDALRNAVRRQGGGAGGGIVQNNTFVSPSWKSAERSQNQLARSAGASLERVRRTM